MMKCGEHLSRRWTTIVSILMFSAAVLQTDAGYPSNPYEQSEVSEETYIISTPETSSTDDGPSTTKVDTDTAPETTSTNLEFSYGTIKPYNAYNGVGWSRNHNHDGLINVNLAVDLLNLGSRSHTEKRAQDQMQKLKSLFSSQAGASMTLLFFNELTDAEKADPLNTLTADSGGSAAIVQDHIISGRHTLADLCRLETVTNMNGHKITFNSVDNCQTVNANGVAVVERNIAVGGSQGVVDTASTSLLIGQRLAARLTFTQATSTTADLVPGVVGNLLGLVGPLLNSVLALVGNVLGGLLTSLGLSRESPLTFISPAQDVLDGLMTAFQRFGLGSGFANANILKLLKDNLFASRITPVDLANSNELNSLAGDKKLLTKGTDGQLKLGENEFNPIDVTPTTNGFIYDANLTKPTDITEQTSTSVPLTTGTDGPVARALTFNSQSEVDRVSTV